MNTFYHGDCLFVMGHDIEPESVDLIYLDPPFFTGKVQKGKIRWQPGAMEMSYEDSKRFWKEQGLASYAPEWLKYIGRTRPDFAAYLFYMMERLEACHKVLKDVGSIYLHCDEKASHYLKMIMDEVFGWDKFRNEIIWCYKGGNAAKKFRKKHDTILFYTKSGQYCFNADATRRPYSPKLFGIAQKDANGNLYYQTGQTEKGKVYLHPNGQLPYDWWDDIPSSTASHGKERVGYPTQKPEVLLERIIKASSNEGDVVLDPFCGCGTAIIVASKLGRRFIGIDIHPIAFEVTKNRGHELFAQSQYNSRDVDEVLSMGPRQFEKWVNGYYKATKPYPDKGVDGITPDGVPIQVKSFTIKYDVLSQFITDAKYHPKTTKPIKKVIVVSQSGFDDGAIQRQYEIGTDEDIGVVLTTPKEMLKVENSSIPNQH